MARIIKSVWKIIIFLYFLVELNANIHIQPIQKYELSKNKVILDSPKTYLSRLPVALSSSIKATCTVLLLHPPPFLIFLLIVIILLYICLTPTPHTIRYRIFFKAFY